MKWKWKYVHCSINGFIQEAYLFLRSSGIFSNSTWMQQNPAAIGASNVLGVNRDTAHTQAHLSGNPILSIHVRASLALQKFLNSQHAHKSLGNPLLLSVLAQTSIKDHTSKETTCWFSKAGTVPKPFDYQGQPTGFCIISRQWDITAPNLQLLHFWLLRYLGFTFTVLIPKCSVAHSNCDHSLVLFSSVSWRKEAKPCLFLMSMN